MSVNVMHRLRAVAEGRRLAESDAEKQRIAEMMAPPPCAPTPDCLTITIDGPQGSGKTVVGSWLSRLRFQGLFPVMASDPQIIEIRDGRRFDVRNEVFLDGREG